MKIHIIYTEAGIRTSGRAQGAWVMLARYVAARLDRLGIHYGWVIVAVTLSVSVTTAGAIGVPGALILPLTKEYGWDIAQISTALAIRLVLFGLMAPFAAALIERYGVRNVVLTAVAMIEIGRASCRERG